MESNWDKTKVMLNRLAEEGKVQYKNGIPYYEGRHVIHRDSPIDGGVYLGQGKREAIVVDSSYPNSKLKELFKTAENKAKENGVIKKDIILQSVYETVKEAIPIQDMDAVNKILKKYGVEKDGKIALDVFLDEGVGVCRQDALACAAVLENFKKRSIVRGKVSVDRNSTFLGGHAWTRYTNSIGELYILDVAQGFCGRLEDASKENRWAYERPTDF